MISCMRKRQAAQSVAQEEHDPVIADEGRCAAATNLLYITMQLVCVTSIMLRSDG